MSVEGLNLAGVELYFEDLDKARSFYRDVLDLKIADEDEGHYIKFETQAGFVCLERKGSESYPSRDKAVLFFEAGNLQAAVERIGREHVLQEGSGWAVLHDPEGHNILLLQPGPGRSQT
jgi:predicted enzyme related to lactoylglutathione lyase